jgi:hypothetical protein
LPEWFPAKRYDNFPDAKLTAEISLTKAIEEVED